MQADITDLRRTIVPKSDQLNAEQLLGGPMTITVSEVRVGSEDQPVILHYAGDGGRPFKPCKTMRKLLIFAWGENGHDWIGRSMTVYNDPNVLWGGIKVGGIRISQMSHIPQPIEISLTATKGKKAMHRVEVLQVVTLQDVLAAIRNASNKAGMDAAKKLAQQLTTQADMDQAATAYNGRLRALRSAAAPAPVEQQQPAFSELADRLADVKTVEDAQAVVNAGAHLPEEQKAELRSLAAALDLPA